MTHNDGGPAFPGAYRAYPHNGPAEGVIVADGGMSLRDWFAGQAIYSCLDGRTFKMKAVDTVASECYRLADAMLEARKK